MKLTCPRCLNQPLRKVPGPRGSEVDACPSCSGVWLDKSEVYSYVADAKRLQAALAQAFKSVAPSRFLCRACDVQMWETSLSQGGPLIDVCRQCGGSWWDKKELDGLDRLSPPPPK